MIKICRNREEIKKYKEFFYLTNISNSIPQLTLSSSLFEEARKIFAAGAVFIEVQKITDENKETIFYLKKTRNMIKNAEDFNIEIDVNFKGYNLLLEKNLDLRLLEKTECYVFEELEEYTYELAKFIKVRFPKAYIFFLDLYADYFFARDDRVRVVESLYDVSTYWDRRYLFITSGEKNYEYIIPESLSLIYNSGNIMNSLCWAKKIESLGDKNSEDTILLIDIEFGVGCGLAYIIRTVCTFAYMAKVRGWIPVINLTGENMYIDKTITNMWNQYFEPLSHISVSEALESKNVISLKNNHLNAGVIYMNPYFREVWEKTEKHPKIKFNKNLIKFFEQSILREFRDKTHKILGAFIRGTDAKDLSEMEISVMIMECREIMKDNGFDKIFLATEDVNIFFAFKDAFKNKLLYIEQKRVSNSGKSKKLVGELLNIKEGERERFGQTYLLITYCLSRCDALVYNIASGGFYMANKWRNTPYDFTLQIDGRISEINSLVKCYKMIRNNSLTVIYGAGVIGKRLIGAFKCKKDINIIFCDRKAENNDFYFCGYRVISPTSLFEKYKEYGVEGIIIASSNYSKEIYCYLIKNGVNPDHILVIRNRNGII